MYEDGLTDRGLEVLPSFAKDACQTQAPLEKRDGSLDSGAESLSKSKEGIGLSKGLLEISLSFLADGNHSNHSFEPTNRFHVLVVALVRSQLLGIASE